jgi:hypothetical protein
MRLSRLRGGERLALVGGVSLAVLLGLNWYFLSTPDARIGAHESGIRSIGWLAALVLLVAIVSALVLAFLTVTQRPTAFPVIASVMTMFFGLAAVLVIVLRLIFQPTLGVQATAPDVELELPAWLGLLAALSIAGGGYLALADERKDARESLEQTEDVLRVRGAPRKVPAGGSDPGGDRQDPPAGP